MGVVVTTLKLVAQVHLPMHRPDQPLVVVVVLAEQHQLVVPIQVAGEAVREHLEGGRDGHNLEEHLAQVDSHALLPLRRFVPVALPVPSGDKIDCPSSAPKPTEL